MSRYARRVDGPHADIVQALRGVGCKVLDLSRVGMGCTDLLVHRPGYRIGNWTGAVLVEIKDGSKPPSKRKLRPSQARFHADWRLLCYTVVSVEDALALVGARVAA